MRTHTLSFLFFALLVSLFTLLSSCSGCKGDGSAAGDSIASTIFDHITEEQLAKFKPKKGYEQNGHSRAFKLRPRKEMRITAKKGAFETDPDIRVTNLTSEQLEQLDRTLAQRTGSELLYAWDIDAGLPYDSVIPGVYTVELNLKALGIPKNLWPYIVAYRTDGGDRIQQISTSVNKKGILRYQARQNSVGAICCVVGKLCLWGVGKALEWGFVFPAIGTPVALGFATFPNLSKEFEVVKEAVEYKELWRYKDWVYMHVNDPNGSFNIHYRYSHTENGDSAKQMVDRMIEFNALSEQLRQQATNDYLRQNPKAAKTWTDPKAQAKHRVAVDSIHQKLLSENPQSRSLQSVVPVSIQDIVRGTRLANQFALDSAGLGLKPLEYIYDVYLLPKTAPFMNENSNAISQKIPGMGGYLGINEDLLYQRNEKKYSYDKKAADKTFVDMAHELAHLYEYAYLNLSLVRDNRFIECIGSVSEYRFTEWLKKKGIIKYDPLDAAHAYMYADRQAMEVLAWPLAHPAHSYPKELSSDKDPDTRGGYMLGAFFEYIEEKTKKRPSFDHIMNQYAYNKTLAQDFMDIFGIKTESELYKYYEGFCLQNITDIQKAQSGYTLNPALSHLVLTDWKHMQSDVQRLRNLGDTKTERFLPFAVKTLKISQTKEKDEKGSYIGDDYRYTLYAVPSPNVKPNEVMFTFLETDSKGHLVPTKDPWGFTPQGATWREAFAAVIFGPDIRGAVTSWLDYYIDLVALYQPQHDPVVKGRSKDGTGLLVDTWEKPNYALQDDGYVSGMQLAVVNHQTGKSKTFNIPLEKCGKTVKLEFAKIGVTDKDDIDISVRTRWYFKHPNGKRYFSPATDRVHYKKKKEQEQQKKEEVKPDDKSLKEKDDEEVDDDLGAADIDQRFKLTHIGWLGVNTQNFGVNYELNNTAGDVYGRLKVKGDEFRIIIPTHHTSISFDDGDGNSASIPGFTLSGKCTVDRRGTSVGVTFDKNTIRMSPSTLHTTRENHSPAENWSETLVSTITFVPKAGGKEGNAAIGMSTPKYNTLKLDILVTEHAERKYNGKSESLTHESAVFTIQGQF